MEEKTFAAVLILDSYFSRFEPFSSTSAECLLPLIAGRTLLDETLHFLVDINQVKQVVLVGGRFLNQIGFHLKGSGWLKKNIGIQINVFDGSRFPTFGGVIRELLENRLIKSEHFILMTATAVISNLRLNQVLKTHQETCQKWKNLGITTLYTPALQDVEKSNKTLFLSNSNNKAIINSTCDQGIKVEQIRLFKDLLNDFHLISRTRFNQCTNLPMQL